MSARGIRVLIVDDVAESRDNVERLLRFEPDVQIVGKASRGQEGIDLAFRLNPDIILMDINMPDMDGVTATREITSRNPTVAVIMMSVQDEPDLLRRAMLAGAREFLAKPFSLDELVTAVRHVSEMTQQTKQHLAIPAPGSSMAPAGLGSRAHVFGIFSSKGGVGRSLIATNLAVALRQLTGKQVALVDANVHFGDIGVMMNVAGGKTIADVVAQIRSLDADLLEEVLVTHASGTRLLLAPATPQEAEAVTAEHLRTILAQLVKIVDYVVVDTRPGFDESMLALMDLCDRLLLVLTMEMTAIKDTRQFLEITELLGYPDEKVQLVLNRANNVSGIPVADIAENLRRPLEFKLPEEPAPLLRSVNEGTPIVAEQPNLRFSEEIRRLAVALAPEDAPEPALNGRAAARGSGLVVRLRTALGHS